jgi:hypothetical protein|tara:strand:- start:132 stop:368 length:237 start_codon:yes stop_codon:yes gene_type:complete
MSAEKEALTYLQDILAIIKETLEEEQKSRKDSRRLTQEENKALNSILTKIKQVRTKLLMYLKNFRTQSSLDDFTNGRN